jgi:hypothetical protein
MRGLKCSHCGQPVKVSKEGFWQHFEDDGRRMWIWHHGCLPPWAKEHPT